jgi:hypothetical protein
MTAGMSWDLSKSQESVAHISVYLLHLTFGQQDMRSKSWLRIRVFTYKVPCADICNAHSSGEKCMGTAGCEFFLSMYSSGLTFYTICLCIFVSVLCYVSWATVSKYLCLLLWLSCLWSVWSKLWMKGRQYEKVKII